jgi:hypothetical protein
MAAVDFEPPPGRNLEAFGPNAAYNQKRCHQLAQGFFKDAVQRAKDRNYRYSQFKSEMN